MSESTAATETNAGTIFRKRALDSLSSPADQLDKLLRVTSARGWLALVAMVAVVMGIVLYGFFGTASTTVSGQGLFLPPGGLVRVDATTGGTVAAVVASEGDEISVGDPIATIVRADGSRKDVVSAVAGDVTEILVNEGNVVGPGSELAIVEPLHELATAVIYVPSGEGKAIRIGMGGRLSPSTAPSEQYGQLVAEVINVSRFPVSSQRLQYVLHNDLLVQQIASLGSVLEVTMTVASDPDNPSGLEWTSGDGPPFTIQSGTLASASVIVDAEAPAKKLFDPNE